MATRCIIPRVRTHVTATRNTFPGFGNTISRVNKHVSRVAICASRDRETHFQGPGTRFPVSRNALPGFRYAFPGFGKHVSRAPVQWEDVSVQWEDVPEHAARLRVQSPNRSAQLSKLEVRDGSQLGLERL